MELHEKYLVTEAVKKVGDSVTFKKTGMEWAGVVKKIDGNHLVVDITKDLHGDWKQSFNTSPYDVVVKTKDAK